MATYTIDLNLPFKNTEQLIESLREIGAVESIQFSIEAKTHREAVNKTIVALKEFEATYNGVDVETERVEAIREEMERHPARNSY